MERKFVLSCCSTVDLPYAYMAQRDIPVLFYHYVVGNQEYVDDMGRDPAALPRFYGFLKAGQLPQTSQINVADYLDFFEEQLQKGDLLHIAFTSGQSGSVHNAQAAKAAALKHAGLSESQVRELQVEWDSEHGRAVYEVEFKSGGMEYDYVIDAATGAVLDHETERDD